MLRSLCPKSNQIFFSYHRVSPISSFFWLENRIKTRFSHFYLDTLKICAFFTLATWSYSSVVTFTSSLFQIRASSLPSLETNLHKILARKIQDSEEVSFRKAKLLTKAYYMLLRESSAPVVDSQAQTQQMQVKQKFKIKFKLCGTSGKFIFFETRY